MADKILLNEAAYAVWEEVFNAGEEGIDIGELASRRQIDQSQVTAVAAEAAANGFFDAPTELELEQVIASEAGFKLMHSNSLPEQLAAIALNDADSVMQMPAFVEWSKLKGVPVNEALKWGGARGWISKDKGAQGPEIRLTPIGKQAVGIFRNGGVWDEPDLVMVHRAYMRSLASPPEQHYLESDPDDARRSRIRSLLANRPELAKLRKRKVRTLRINGEGAVAFRDRVKPSEEYCNRITHEDLVSGEALRKKYRPYDVNLAADLAYPAKIHPLRKIIEQTRRAFLEMGFAEVVSPMVESAFWNFDALFQPQDHPARDMQDTFYMLHPAEAPLPAASVVEPVKQTHENGWETGSEGWGYTWSPERSKQVVLRTHTTAATIRALAANPNPPGKFFCVGWTYRNETISFKHLPVFHQVDGIIIDEEANLASLMGTLQEFYSKMGFGRVKFKPAFYPYTEPSVDVVVYMEARGKWLEMGGAGIFRPEVTLPLGCKYPVLAWGLGIERLAMLRFGLSDIRELYRPSLDALEGVPLCR
jgi:phenylalanyl-tRNA synthetase alpha chain